MKRAILGALVAVGLASSVPVSAAETTRNDLQIPATEVIEAYRKGDLAAGTYIKGVASGVVIAEMFHPPPHLFCLPSTLGLTPDQVSAIILSYIHEHPDHAKIPANFAVVVGLKETFPCK
jgi:hypothetical protein